MQILQSSFERFSRPSVSTGCRRAATARPDLDNTTNRPVLFLEGVRPRGARRSRNFLHYLVWEKGGNLGTFFSIQFGKKGRRGARPWRAFLVASSDVGQVRIGLRGVSIGAALQAQQGARSGGGYAPSIDRCARSVLLLTRRSCSRAVQLRGNKNKQKTSEHPFTPTECCRSRACGSPTSRRPRLHR